MALMKLTAFNGGIKGKVNGTIFQITPQGQVVKGGLIDAVSAGARLTKADAGRIVPVKRNLTQISSAWRSLSDTDRASWTANASLFPFKNRWGENYTPSGFLLYMRVNLNLMKAGIATIDVAPGLETIVNAGPMAISFDAMAHTFSLDSYTAGAGMKASIWATGQISPGAVPKPSQFKLIYVTTGVETLPFNLTSYYTDVFGQYPLSGNIWFKMTNVNGINGQPGQPYFLQLVYP